MYAYSEESQTSNMDNWEDKLVNDFYEIEAGVEEYLRSVSQTFWDFRRSSKRNF